MRSTSGKDANRRSAGAKDRSGLALPVLLADQQGVAFVATARGFESLRVPRRFWAVQVGVVPIPVSDEEIHSTELQPTPDPGTWPMVAPRPDLLSPALSRLFGDDYAELSLQPSRDGLRAVLVSRHGDEHPFPIAPKDSLGFLAAVFLNTPRGVVATASGKPARVLLSVRPAERPHEYRLRLVAVIPDPLPTTLANVGLSTSVLEHVLGALDRTSGILLVSGGPNSGRSTTLELLASVLAARGFQGGRIGRPVATARPDITWLAGSVSDWPFPESLHALAPDFVLMDRLESSGDLVIAARLASTGRLVLVSAPAADAEALARNAAREIELGAAPSVPITVLGQALLRTVCRSCAAQTTVPTGRIRRLGFHRRDFEEMEKRGGLSLLRGRGCHACAETGASGLSCVFEYVGAEEGSGSLPTIREEGWRRAALGEVLFEDVCTLPGAHRVMRSLREIMVHAGQNPDVIAQAIVGPPGREHGVEKSSAAAETAGKPETGVGGFGPAVAESTLLSGLLRDALRGRQADEGTLENLARSIAGRAMGPQDVKESLAPSRGFHLARHLVNTALIAVRLSTFLKIEGDRSQIARLGLLHDVGLLETGIDPDADLEPTASEASLDPSGSRFEPRPFLTPLGCDDPGIASLIGQVHSMLGVDPLDPAERLRVDLRAQVVALSSLVDMQSRTGGNGDHPSDLHDVTSVMIEKHGRRFSPFIFRALLRAIPIFPIGSLVELSSGDVARVVSLNPDNHFRPKVEITAPAAGEAFTERRVIDLARAPFLHIQHRIADSLCDSETGR